jgi:predicted PP-loop superfamily ATPase
MFLSKISELKLGCPLSHAPTSAMKMERMAQQIILEVRGRLTNSELGRT